MLCAGASLSDISEHSPVREQYRARVEAVLRFERLWALTKSQLLGILNGLATVAANSGNPALADELRIFLRKYRHDDRYGVSIEEVMIICLVASASHKEMMEWREFVGDWLTELAFWDNEGDEGSVRR